MIEVRDASVSYPGAGHPALSGVSLTVAPGELVALLGANGSGKSTLIRLCNALLQPSAGFVAVDGLDACSENNLRAIRSRVGFVQQNPENQIVGTVVEEDVAFGPENLGVPTDELRSRVDEALAQTGLTGFERREPHLLSEGQKQRLAIAGALALRPAYLLLDEPTAMLDGRSRAEVLGVLGRLRQQGVGMLHITHHVEDVADADRVVVLSAGRVAYAGSLDPLVLDQELADSLGIEVPPMARLGMTLRTGGVGLARALPTPEEVGVALWG